MTSVPKHVRIELTLPVRELAVLCCYKPSETNVQDIVTNALNYAALDCQDDETLWPDADLATLYLHKYIAGLRTDNMDINAKRVQDDLLLKSNVVDNTLNAMRKKLLDSEPDTATPDSTTGADALVQVREKVEQVMGSKEMVDWIKCRLRSELRDCSLVMDRKTLSLESRSQGCWDARFYATVVRHVAPGYLEIREKPSPSAMRETIRARVEEILLQNIEEGITYDQEEN